MKRKKLLQRLMSGSQNVRFQDFRKCVEAFGFKLDRVKGSHHIFVHPDIPELINLQNIDGKTKPYQIKQLLKIIEGYNLEMGGKE